MSVVPLPGVGPQAARDALAEALLACGNIRTSGLSPPVRLHAYRSWSIQTAGALAHVLRPPTSTGSSPPPGTGPYTP